MELKIILTFIAGLITAYVTVWNAERKISIENITKERAKWRDKIRELSVNVNTAMVESDNEKLSILRSQFRLLLNPDDKEDQHIIGLLSLSEKEDNMKKANEFSICLSYLLKHDWERAKIESKPLYKRLKVLNKNDSESTSSNKKLVKLIYVIFYHPIRNNSDNKSQKS